MRLRIVAAVCFLMVFAAPGAPVRFDSLKVGSTTYTNVTVLSVNETDVFFRHEDGVANAKLKRLDPQAQKALGYNAEVALRTEQIQAVNEQTYQSNVLASIEAVQAPAPAKTSQENALCDPVSDRSLVGKPGPALNFEKWKDLTEAPSGKYVLVFFWTQWSVPARAALSHVAALQKKFPQKLAVLGLDPDPAGSKGQDTEEQQVPTIPDEQGIIAAASGATSVPFALLMDPEKNVLYQGHPGALTEAALTKLLGKTE